MINLDHVSLDNQSRYSLGVIEFLSELCDRLFADTTEMNEKCHKLNPACHKTVHHFFYKIGVCKNSLIFALYKNTIRIQPPCATIIKLGKALYIFFNITLIVFI